MMEIAMGEMVTIPLDEYRALKLAAEDLEDLRAFDRVSAAIDRGEEELVPGEIVTRMLAGEHPLRVWREYRGMTQVSLAKASGVNRVQISDIEAGKKRGSIVTLKKLTDALDIAIDDVI